LSSLAPAARHAEAGRYQTELPGCFPSKFPWQAPARAWLIMPLAAGAWPVSGMAGAWLTGAGSRASGRGRCRLRLPPRQCRPDVHTESGVTQ
jgi:hypothetical protein